MHTTLNPVFVFAILLVTGPMVYMIHCASETLARNDDGFHRDEKSHVAAEAIFWVTTAMLTFPLVFAFSSMEAEFVRPGACWLLYVNTFVYGVGFEGIIYLLRLPRHRPTRRTRRTAVNGSARDHGPTK